MHNFLESDFVKRNQGAELFETRARAVAMARRKLSALTGLHVNFALQHAFSCRLAAPNASDPSLLRGEPDSYFRQRMHLCAYFDMVTRGILRGW